MSRAEDGALELRPQTTGLRSTWPCSACGGRGCGPPDRFGNRDACDRCEGSGVGGGPDALLLDNVTRGAKRLADTASATRKDLTR
jgi:hypothetical protein